MNKIGSDKIISVYWFVILIIIAGGIFAMVYTYYNYPYNVREVEANILATKVADCISENGEIKKNILEFDSGNKSFLLNNQNFLEKCNLNFNVESEYDWEKKPQYFLEVNFYEFNERTISILEVSSGNKNWKSDCEIKKEDEEDYRKLPKCVKREFYSLDENNNQYLIKILAIVGKIEKNVK